MAFFTAKDSDILNTLEAIKTEHALPETSGLAFKTGGAPVVRGDYACRVVQLAGFKEAVYTHSSNASPLCGSFGTVNGLVPYLPTTNEFLKIASTSVNDTAAGSGCRAVGVFGLDTSFNPVFEVVPLNGQTPVTTTLGFYRIGRVVQLENGTPASYNASGNQGTIYTCANAAVFTAGVPTNSNNIADVMLPNQGVTPTDIIPVQAGSEIFISDLTVSSTVGGKNDTLVVDVRVRQGTSGWRTFASIESSTAQPVVTIRQPGFQTLSVAFLPDNTDVSIAIRRLGGSGTTDDVQVNVFMSCYIVTPIP